MKNNVVVLIGRLGKDAEVKELTNGKTVTNASLATDESFKPKGATEWTKKTVWHFLTFWGQEEGEYARKFWKKGAEIKVTGRLAYEEFTPAGSTTKVTKAVIVVSETEPVVREPKSQPAATAA